MFSRVVDCITYQHQPLLLGLAALICVLGSLLTVRLFMRARHTLAIRRKIQLSLSASVAGTTVWATHFVALLAYDPGVEVSFDPLGTLVSLLIAMAGSGIALLVATANRTQIYLVVSGVVFGLTTSAMHYNGMASVKFAGEITYDMASVLLSLGIAVFFGAMMFHRVGWPFTRFCWMGGSIAMVLCILSLHLIGMGSIVFDLNPTAAEPERLVSDHTLGIAVAGVTALVLIVALAAFVVEGHLDRETQALLKDAALVDQLTKLPNRLQLRQHYFSLERARTNGHFVECAILTFDIDNFKMINDIHGIGAGDQLLVALANMVSSICSEKEFVARSGGDEFVVILDRAQGDRDAFRFASKLNRLLEQTFTIDGIILRPTVSVGIAIAPDDGNDLNTLMTKSELAMSRAKLDTDRKIKRYDPEMDQQARAEAELIEDLRQAMDLDQLSLNFQLQNDIRTEKVCGFEVLMRWYHPEKGQISPTVFIPLAESSGLIRELGLWILEAACKEAATWDKDLPIAVNVAPQQLLQRSFLRDVASILETTKFPAHLLELEITEASIIEDKENTLAVMHGLRKMGIRIAMDDFGTGYSSLAMLQAFPFDKIKIDRSFIIDVNEHPERAAIVEATVLIGEAMSIPVLVEGVEKREELAFLRRVGCHIVQGFIFGKPLSLDQVREITVLPDDVKAAGWY